MKGLPYVLFMIRAAGPVGVAHAEAYARMLREEGSEEAAKRVDWAIRTPFTDAEKIEMLKPNGLEPS